MRQINWGMIGCGDVTEKKSAPSFNKIAHSSLAGVMNRTREKAVSYADRHDVPKVFATAKELIEDPGIDVIYIATPPSSHAEYSILSMQAGKPVYVEKPMAATYKDCIRMNEVSGETGVPLFVAYYRRSMDYFLKVRKLLKENAIGNPVLCHSQLFVPPRPVDYKRHNLTWRVIPEISGGGYFHDMGCHELDVLLFLFGDVKTANGHAGNVGGLYSPEDTIIASMEFESGLLYNGSWCFAASKESACDKIEIIGESGSIKFSCFGYSAIEIITSAGRTEYPVSPPKHVQYPMIKSIVEELRGEGRSPSHGESAAKVNWLMEKILSRESS